VIDRSRRFRGLVGACACALLVSCSDPPPRIDMSTPQAEERSMREVRRALSDADRVRFTAAASTLARHEQAVGGDAARDGKAALKRALDGLTAEEVIAAAEALPTPVSRATPRAASTS